MRCVVLALLLSCGKAMAQPNLPPSGAATAQSTAAPIAWLSIAAAAGVNNLVLATKPTTVAYMSVCANASEPLYMRLYDQAIPPNGSQTPFFRMQVPPGMCSAITSGVMATTMGLAVTITPVQDDTDQTAVGAAEFFLNVGLR